MTFCFSRPLSDRTPFGIFHNLDAPNEEHGHISIHLFRASFELIWKRSQTNEALD